MNAVIENHAGLKCRIIDSLAAGQSPTKLVVLCHGFGASGSDLADFGPYMIENSVQIAKSCRFVFPEAPMDLAHLGMPGGRAWWPINMATLAEMHQTKSYEVLTQVEPDGMAEASEQLARAVRQLQAASGLDDASTVLGGFSQGAMVSTDTVLRRGINPAHLILFSGTLLCRDTWQQAAAVHQGCKVFQSHGRQDPVLPFEPAEWLRDMLTENGFDVDFHPFNGQHTIPMEMLRELSLILEK